MLYEHTEQQEALTDVLGRTVRTAHQVGFTRDLLMARWSNVPDLVPVLVREGVSIRTIHHVNACLYPDRTAIVDDHRELTFSEANAEINRLANAMQSRFGIERGTPVALAMHNRAEYLLLWMALSRLGASTIHASWRQTAGELAYQIEHSGARLMFAGASVGDAVEQLREEASVETLDIIGVDGTFGDYSYDALVEGASDEFPHRRRSSKDGNSDNVVYTSGTTGRPKGAVRDLAAYGLVEFFRLLERLPVRTADRHLIVSPMYHSGGQVFSLMNTALGATLFILPEFDARRTLETLHDEAINTVFLVPTMLRRILELPDEVRQSYSTPALRGIFCGAAPFPQSLRQQAIDEFGASVIHDFYGATELGWITLIDGEEMLDRPGSVGRPIAGQEVRIADEQGRTMGPNERGMIYVCNEQIMAGYLDDDEATDEILDDGWMTVDDLGYLDEDGYLYLAGRERDMVISGGVNIYPAEIEEVLATHEAVREVAVIGLPDEEWGESLLAVVVAEEEFESQQLEAHARRELSGYKVPRRWEFVDELPRNPTGKVLKRQLEQQFR